MNRGISAWLLVVGVILVSVNLRAPLTSVSPVIGAISDELRLPSAVAGLITTLPLLAFAAFSLMAPYVARRIGLERMIFAALLLVAAGLLTRPWGGVELLLCGTALGGIGIATCNVLLPAFIKRAFPLQLGLMTGVYTVTMNLLGSVASGASVPASQAFGVSWEWTLAFWGVVALCSAAIWGLTGIRSARSYHLSSEEPKVNRQKDALWRYKLSWQMSLYIGLQSFLFFVVMAWLPDIADERGIDAASAGLMVALMQFGGLPFNMAMPLFAGKVRDQRWLALATAAIFATGVACLFMEPSWALALGAAMIGIGGGSSFSLAIMFFHLRTHDEDQAARMSGMAQSFGYTLASAGPPLFGWLHDRSGSWDVPLTLLVAAVALFAWAGLGSGSDRKLPTGSIQAEVAMHVHVR